MDLASLCAVGTRFLCGIAMEISKEYLSLDGLFDGGEMLCVRRVSCCVVGGEGMRFKKKRNLLHHEGVGPLP